MRVIIATDITGPPELRGLWFPGYDVPDDLPRRAGLDPGGFASPLGYWLVLHEGPAPAPAPEGGMRLIVTAPGAEPPEDARPTVSKGVASRRYRTQTIVIKAPDPDQGKLTLTIGPGTAHVRATEQAWEALAGPIILVVCQFWRLQAIDKELDQLTRDARENLGYANAPGLRSLPQSQRLMELAWKMRAAIVDLIYFEKPLTDPDAYFDAPRSARYFRHLAERFRLDEWSESIDYRAEVVEGTFETITEKVYYLKSHLHDVILEVVIVAILVLDIGVNLWSLFA